MYACVFFRFQGKINVCVKKFPKYLCYISLHRPKWIALPTPARILIASNISGRIDPLVVRNIISAILGLTFPWEQIIWGTLFSWDTREKEHCKKW